MEKEMQTAKEIQITKEQYIAVLERNMELEAQVLELNQKLDIISQRHEELCAIAQRLYVRLETAKKYFRKERDEHGKDEYFRV